MPNDDRGRGGGPSRVQVFHFPKREKAPSPTEEALRGDRAPTLTLPEFRPDPQPDDELVTQPHRVGVEPQADAGRATPPWPRRTSSGEKRKGPSVRGKRRRPSPRKSTPSERPPSGAQRRGGGAAPEPENRALPVDQALVGHQLFELGRLDEAREVFEQLVGQEPQEAFPYTMLGTIYLALGDPSRALALFEAALQLEPDELAALVYRGEIRLSLGKTKKAMLDLSRAVELGLGDDPFVERARRLMRLAQDSRPKP